jgi:hypothetical protein
MCVIKKQRAAGANCVGLLVVVVHLLSLTPACLAQRQPGGSYRAHARSAARRMLKRTPPTPCKCYNHFDATYVEGGGTAASYTQANTGKCIANGGCSCGSSGFFNLCSTGCKYGLSICDSPPPPRPPPRPPAPACPALDGVYQLVAGGRSACTRRLPTSKQREYLVYSGGSAASCANNTAFLSTPGRFKPQRSRWELRASSAALATAGRNCPDGERGLAGPKTAANAKVFLASKTKRHRWKVVRVPGDCTLVNIIDSTRAAGGAPAYLSSPPKCADTVPLLVAKDLGTGGQRWRLTKVA